MKKKKSSLIKVGDILATMVKTTPLGENLEQAEIWVHWDKIAGAALAAHGRPEAVKDGELHIAADSSVAMNRFIYNKYRIVKNVNRMAGKELISGIFVRLMGDEEVREADNEE